MMYDKVKAEVQRAVAAMRQRATTGRAGLDEILALAVLEHEEPYREGEPWTLDAPTAAILRMFTNTVLTEAVRILRESEQAAASEGRVSKHRGEA